MSKLTSRQKPTENDARVSLKYYFTAGVRAACQWLGGRPHIDAGTRPTSSLVLPRHALHDIAVYGDAATFGPVHNNYRP